MTGKHTPGHLPLEVLRRVSDLCRRERAEVYVYADTTQPGGYGVGTGFDGATFFYGQQPIAKFNAWGGRLELEVTA